jgi:hypothetical protein
MKATFFANAVNLDDVRVVQPGGNLCLTLEPRQVAMLEQGLLR